MKDLLLGIDLGTTNSVASIAHEGANGNIVVETLKISQIGEDGITPEESELFPSVLYVSNDERYVGKYAKAMRTQKRKNIISGSKNFIGEGVKWIIDNKEYDPKIVASFILKGIRNHVGNVYGDRIDLTSAVITVPASFDQDQKRETREAAMLAGFDSNNIVLISEPTAALLDFVNEQRNYKDSSKYIDFSSKKRVLVFDLGGGTCDVSILDVQMKDSAVSLDEIAVSEHTLIGGNNFDNYAVEGIINSYESINNIKLEEELSEEEYKEFENQLNIRCEQAKIFFAGRYDNYLFSENKEELLKKLKFPIGIQNIIKNKPFIYELKFEDYNKFISPLLSGNNLGIKNIVDPILETLNSINCDSKDIDYVFTVGGMTKYPTVMESIKKIFNKEPLTMMDRMNSVSRGAAVYHHYSVNFMEDKNMDEENSEYNVIPSMPQSVFLNVKNGFPMELIKAGTKAGTPIILENQISANTEIGAELELYAGKSFFDPHLRKLKNVTLDFSKGVQIGEGITLKIEYDKKGMLNFDAWVTNNSNMRIGVNLDSEFTNEDNLNEIKRNYKIDSVRGGF